MLLIPFVQREKGIEVTTGIEKGPYVTTSHFPTGYRDLFQSLSKAVSFSLLTRCYLTLVYFK